MRRLAAMLALLAAMPLHAQPGNAIWTTLGTSGGPQVRPERAQISNALLAGGATYLFDVGNDVQRQMARAGIAERSVSAIFLSHHHLDHVADLGPLLWTRWTFGGGPLTVVGPMGTRTMVARLIEAAAPIQLAGYPTAGPAGPALAELVTVVEVPADDARPRPVFTAHGIKVQAVGVDHFQSRPSIPLSRMPQAIAFRVETPGRTIVYTGDSGPSARRSRLAQDADLLVSEVVDLEAIGARLDAETSIPLAARRGIVAGMAVNHLTSAEVGRLAHAARVRKVVLTHFVPVPEEVPDRSRYGREIARYYDGPVQLARDLDRF